MGGRLHFTERYGNTLVANKLKNILLFDWKQIYLLLYFNNLLCVTVYWRHKAAVQTGPLEMLQFIVSFAFKLIWSLNTKYPDCVHLASTCDCTLSVRFWSSSCLSSVRLLSLTRSSPANSKCLCRGSYPWCPRGRNNTRVLLYFTLHLLYTNAMLTGSTKPRTHDCYHSDNRATLRGVKAIPLQA